MLYFVSYCCYFSQSLDVLSRKKCHSHQWFPLKKAFSTTKTIDFPLIFSLRLNWTVRVDSCSNVNGITKTISMTVNVSYYIDKTFWLLEKENAGIFIMNEYTKMKWIEQVLLPSTGGDQSDCLLFFLIAALVSFFISMNMFQALLEWNSEIFGITRRNVRFIQCNSWISYWYPWQRLIWICKKDVIERLRPNKFFAQ